MSARNRLHLGCGLTTPADWINVDGSWNARIAKYPWLRRFLGAIGAVTNDKTAIGWSQDILWHDLRRPLPFPDNSMVAVYSSHTLEHLYLSQAQALLGECFRVIIPGGIIRIVVPDLKAIIDEYMDAKRLDHEASPTMSAPHVAPADRVNQRLLMRQTTPPTGNLLSRMYQCSQDFHSHKWMYDAGSLSYYMSLAGFVDVQEMMCCCSKITDIQQIETSERLLCGAGLAIEATKQY